MKVYIALMSNSEADRTDIVYCGENEETAASSLWKAYNEYRNTDNPTDDQNYKYEDFVKAAKQANNSAYLQFSDYHINFELHEYKK